MMKILFTGGSSFTGYWFIKELAEGGYDVHATFTGGGVEDYAGVRAERVRKLQEFCTPVWDCVFGQQNFLELIQQQTDWDVLCHHAANVTDYKSNDFDIGAALSANTFNLRVTLETLLTSGCKKVVLTGSVFEQNEGAGEQPLRAFSPYGLSKGLTSEVFKYWCQIMGFSLGKFVIPNPFGPHEEARFTSYLVNSWMNGKKAGVNTPAYVRDNIHVSLLAGAYRAFVQNLDTHTGFEKVNPSGYVESQGAFAQRVAYEMKNRLDLPCVLELGHQTVFDEPMTRVNYDRVDLEVDQWSESAAWDQLAEFYLTRSPI